MRWIAIAAAVLLAGCSMTAEPRGVLGKLWRLEVGPVYRRPAVDTPDAFRGRVTRDDAASIADVPWWEVFGDAALRRLVAQSLGGNYDLQAAVARIEQARAQVGIAASDLYPQIGYQGSAASEIPSVRSTTFNSLLSALNLSWEIDGWGRIRRSTETARVQACDEMIATARLDQRTRPLGSRKNLTALTSIRELMGHKTLAMTLRYAHLSQSHLHQAVKQLDAGGSFGGSTSEQVRAPRGTHTASKSAKS